MKSSNTSGKWYNWYAGKLTSLNSTRQARIDMDYYESDYGGWTSASLYYTDIQGKRDLVLGLAGMRTPPPQAAGSTKRTIPLSWSMSGAASRSTS